MPRWCSPATNASPTSSAATASWRPVAAFGRKLLQRRLPVETGAELFKRVKALPGYGDQKARIFAALLAKQLDVQPDGWREVIGPYAEQGSFRSVADVVDGESLQKVRDFKKQAKAAAKAAAAK